MGLVTLAAAVLPAAAAGAQTPDRCAQRADGPRHSARATWQVGAGLDSRLRTVVHLCDHRSGRERTVRRAVWDDDGRPLGRVIGDASAARGRLAWIEARYTPRGRTRYRAVARVVVRSIRTGRVLRSVVVGRAADADPFSGGGFDQPPLGVELTGAGELAWLVGRKLVVAAPGRRARVITRTAAAPLQLEDGITLVWGAHEGFGFHDLRRPPSAGGCPRRSKWTTVARSPEAVVTEGAYGRASHLRVCRPARGDDPVVAHVVTYDGEGTTFGGVTAGFGRVAYTTLSTGRYGHCTYAVSVLDAATLRTTRKASIDCFGPDTRSGPGPRSEFVLTAAGAPSWIARRGTDEELLAVDAGGRVVALDRGDLADLRADGDDVTWTSAGRPRRARP